MKIVFLPDSCWLSGCPHTPTIECSMYSVVMVAYYGVVRISIRLQDPYLPWQIVWFSCELKNWQFSPFPSLNMISGTIISTAAAMDIAL